MCHCTVCDYTKQHGIAGFKIARRGDFQCSHYKEMIRWSHSDLMIMQCTHVSKYHIVPHIYTILCGNQK
jgi:hypothetical protein